MKKQGLLIVAVKAATAIFYTTKDLPSPFLENLAMMRNHTKKC
jgi:hypothetical protein